MDTERLEKLAAMGDEGAARELARAQARESSPYKVGGRMEVPVKRLHTVVQEALVAVGYHKSTATIHFAHEVDMRVNAAFEANRGFVYKYAPPAPLQLCARGGYNGGWGTREEYAPTVLPHGEMVIKGENGGKGTYVDVWMTPEDAANWINRENTEVTLDDAEKQALALLVTVKPSYRRDSFNYGVWSPEHPALQRLIGLGFAKRHGKGVQATGEGKAYCRNHRLRYY